MWSTLTPNRSPLIGYPHPVSTKLLERKFNSLFRLARDQIVARDNARAGVPAQKRVVVAGRTNCFSFLKPTHRFAKKIVSLKSAIRCVLAKFRFPATLRYDPGIIRAVVLRFHSRKKLFRLGVADRVAFFESIRQREQQGDDRLLVFGIGF